MSENCESTLRVRSVLNGDKYWLALCYLYTNDADRTWMDWMDTSLSLFFFFMVLSLYSVFVCIYLRERKTINTS